MRDVGKVIETTFGVTRHSADELDLRVRALRAAEQIGATHVPADLVDGTGLVVDVTNLSREADLRLLQLRFVWTWSPFQDGTPERCWMLHDPTPGDHPSACRCHRCVAVCCCGDYLHDHTGHDGHPFVEQNSYARAVAHETARKARL